MKLAFLLDARLGGTVSLAASPSSLDWVNIVSLLDGLMGSGSWSVQNVQFNHLLLHASVAEILVHSCVTFSQVDVTSLAILAKYAAR